jgi:hypothetical protein
VALIIDEAHDFHSKTPVAGWGAMERKNWPEWETTTTC